MLPGMRRESDRLKYESLLESLETLRCSNCLEPLEEETEVYERRVASPDPDGESEVTNTYCTRCVTLDPGRKKRPVIYPDEGTR